MNKIIYDIELQPIKQNENVWGYYRNYINQIKNKNNKDLVKLGLYCAKYCFDYNDETTKTYAQKCIDLVEKWLIIPNSATEKELIDAAYNAAYNAALSTSYAAYNVFYDSASYASCLYYCSKISNINMNLPHQYLQTLLRTTKQFNTNNPYSQTIEQISKQDIDKLELVDYNMLLDISNEHYNIDLSEFCYDNIFSRRNLIEMIRREYDCTIGVAK